MPVPWDFREVLDEAMQEHKSGLIHYFSRAPQVERAEGEIRELLRDTTGEYLLTDKGEKIRLDRIITLFGTPGPAYDHYEGYGNACMTCSGEPPEDDD